MNVVLVFEREVVVDDQLHLLHIDPTRKQISRDKHSSLAATEAGHHIFALLCIHTCMDASHCKVISDQAVGQPVCCRPGVDKDYGLCYGYAVVDVL